MPKQFIELGLFKRRKSDSDSIIVRVAKLSARLLALVSQIAIESESLKTSKFLSKLEQYRTQLDRATDSRTLEDTIEKCLALCQDYFRQAQGYLLERENEIKEVIDLLREALSTLTGEADTFNQRLLDSSVRFKRLVEIEDLRELKRQITQEVNEFTRIVAEKRKRDQEVYAKMSKRFEVLQEKLRQTKQEVLLDPLTHVGNRRSMDHALKRAIQESKKPIILAILDIDDFKDINDIYGHQVGDQALMCVAGWLVANVRSGDFLARYGGDEFVVLLTNTSLPQAEMRFLQLLANIAASQFNYHDGNETRTIRLSVSCGLAEYLAGDTSDDLMRRADKGLYEAKKRGKNCLVTWREAG
jgi:diguanylate cyclase